ncbi:MAG: replicative DNA helicase [Clostridia bacterium]|nr:replicative DNA helicase [Clostridia bacterium]
MDVNFNSADGTLNQPFSLEAEQAVLGCILTEPSCLTQVQVIINADHFYLPQHKEIFRTMALIEAAGGKIDPLIVLNSLVNDKIYDSASGKKYLFQLAEIVPSTANVESYANIVREKYYIRTLINASKQTIDEASEQDTEADLLLDAAEQRIYNIRQGRRMTGPSKISDIIVNEVYTTLQHLTCEEKDQYKGYPTGFSDLDRIITGLHKSDLVLIGARPAMGKTSFALNLARNVSMIGKRKVVMFSLEMTKEQLAMRVLSTEARVNSSKMRTGELDSEDWERIAMATGVLADCELYFDDTSSITVAEMKAKVRRMKDVECVIIDYLGLIKPGGKTDNRVQQVSEITRELKMMAKDLMIPVVCCAQLSRGTEGRGKSHRPQLADLRESGSIEQDADIVMMLYRPNYYKGEKDDDNEDGDNNEQKEELSNEAEVIVAKNRHGSTETVKMVWDADHTLFMGLEKIKNDM